MCRQVVVTWADRSAGARCEQVRKLPGPRTTRHALRKRNIRPKRGATRADHSGMNPPDRDRPRRPAKGERGASQPAPTGPGSAIASALGAPAAARAPLAADHATDRYTVVAHELANLLDGSLRWLSLAKNRLGADPSATTQRGVGEQL